MKRQLHETLRREIRYKGFTQNQVASQLGLCHTAFVRRLQGQTPIAVSEAYKILRLLDLPLEDLTKYFPENEEI